MNSAYSSSSIGVASCQTSGPEDGPLVAALTETLRDESGYVRHDAATTLGKFGATAKPAAPKLTQLLGDRELSVRKAAQAALLKIDPEAIAKRSPAESTLPKKDAKATSKGTARR
jgi:hypothetical protein